VLKVYDACNQRTAMRFIDDVRRRLPFRVHVVQTDNGAEFQSQFHWNLESQDVKHLYIRPEPLAASLPGSSSCRGRVHDCSHVRLRRRGVCDMWRRGDTASSVACDTRAAANRLTAAAHEAHRVAAVEGHALASAR
jgi:hypothetical protein